MGVIEHHPNTSLQTCTKTISRHLYIFTPSELVDMEEVLVLTSSKDASGMGVIDTRTGSTLCTFKQCIAEAGTLCSIGSSTSSHSGYGSSGDFLAVAQAKKPCINIWQWGKPQVHLQCHVQEITTALAADPLGAFIFAGTMKGWIYCWELSTGELVSAFQAHFKAITRIMVSKVGPPFLISVAEDGTGRAWELHKILDFSESYKHVGRQSMTPFRTWSSHTLPVKDCVLFDTLTTLRVLSCSLDRTLVLYDVLQGQVCLRVSLPHSLESVTCNPTQDLVCTGASNGTIYLIDLTSTAISVTAAHAHVSRHLGGTKHRTGSAGGLPVGTSTLEGHTKAVTSLAFSGDNSSLLSASVDGTVRVWNVWTRQCLREFAPLGKHAITNAMLIPMPETVSIGVTRPTVCPVSHLSKYFRDQQASQHQTGATNSGNSILMLGPTLLSRHDPKTCTSRPKRAALGTAKKPRRDDISSVDAADDFVEVQPQATEEDEGDEEEDFMELSTSFVAPKKAKLGKNERKRKSLELEAAAEARADVAEKDDLQERLQQALSKLAALEGQNAQLLLQVDKSGVTEEDLELTIVEESANKKAKTTAAVKDKTNRRKSIALSAMLIAAEELPAVEEEPFVDLALENVPAVAVANVITAKDKANRRKSVRMPLPVIDEDAELSADALMEADEGDGAAVPKGRAVKDRANRRKSVMARDVDTTKTTASPTAPALNEFATPPSNAADNSDMESVLSVGGTRRHVRKSVQFSGQDQVKLITPHKLPGFCPTFKDGVGTPTASKNSSSNSKNSKKGKGRK